MKSALYKHIWLPDLGYVVYRDCFDQTKCRGSEGVLAHRQATFVDEEAAMFYCAVRNKGVDRFGDDSLEHFKKLTGAGT